MPSECELLLLLLCWRLCRCQWVDTQGCVLLQETMSQACVVLCRAVGLWGLHTRAMCCGCSTASSRSSCPWLLLQEPRPQARGVLLHVTLCMARRRCCLATAAVAAVAVAVIIARV
jgi:hypothetical protein